LKKTTFLVTVLPLLLLTAYNTAFAQQKQGLVIVSDNAFNDNDETFPRYHIVGEVQNNGSQTAKFVQVSATLRPDSVMGGDLNVIDHYAVQVSSS
jgi:hypothetical protein